MPSLTPSYAAAARLTSYAAAARPPSTPPGFSASLSPSGFNCVVVGKGGGDLGRAVGSVVVWCAVLTYLSNLLLLRFETDLGSSKQREEDSRRQRTNTLICI
jgi:hypothetical protein